MPRGRAINWEQLGYSPHNLDDLDTPFTEEELLNTIKDYRRKKLRARTASLEFSIKNAGK